MVSEYIKDQRIDYSRLTTTELNDLIVFDDPEEQETVPADPDVEEAPVHPDVIHDEEAEEEGIHKLFSTSNKRSKKAQKTQDGGVDMIFDFEEGGKGMSN